jgi:hypothetical protein
MFRCLPLWARWRSLAALYFSWQVEKDRFGGICFAFGSLFIHWSRIEAQQRQMTKLSHCHGATSSINRTKRSVTRVTHLITAVCQ